MDKIRVGKRLTELRKRAGLTLQELSKLSGVQIATLSRMEHDKMTGTVETHARVAYFLNVSLSEFYTGIEIKSNVIRPTVQDKAPEIVAKDDAISSLLTQDISLKKMIPTLLTIKPEGKSVKNRTKLLSEEFVYILKGKVEITVGESKYQLKEGNAFYFNANEFHYFKNLCKTPAKMICIRTQ